MRVQLDNPMTLSEIARLLKGKLTCRDNLISFITTDSRECEKGDLFFSLIGDTFDGKNFISDAKNKSAYCISSKAGADILIDYSENHALLDLASEYLGIIDPYYRIAVTGSVGKTTVKNFIYALLCNKFLTCKTNGNFNNEIGLALTLLSLKKQTQICVCELGMNHKGEISLLSKALKPDISIITNIGTAHIGNLGSREAIASAKLEIKDGMNGGHLIINKNEPLLSSVKNSYCISYTDKNADLYAQILSIGDCKSKIYIKSGYFDSELEVSLYSMEQIDCLIYAIAVCDVIGYNENDLKNAISNITPELIRPRYICEKGYKFYDDSYNASYEAVMGALKLISKREKKKSALLGDMLELGDFAEELHYKLGFNCARLGYSKLYTFANYSKDLKRGAVDGGMSEEQIFINENIKDPIKSAKMIIDSYDGETIVVKASHSVNIKRIIEIIINTSEEL